MKNTKLNKIFMISIPLVIALFNLLIIFYPGEIIQASKEGMSLWFNNVFPSLLPFMIGTNLLIHLGAVTFLGTLLEPVMQPLFGISGIGAFPLITGMTSGYPMGAKITADLRQREEITKAEAQKLIGFVNNSGPLFILGTVGIGMFHSAKAGYFLMAVHYISALFAGFIFKYYKYNKNQIYRSKEKNIFRKAFRNMSEERKKHNLSFSRIFADSVIKSMESMIQIGGFIILFSVLVKILEVTDITALILSALRPVSSNFNISDDIVNSLIYGIMEVTNGVKKVSSENFTSQQLIAAACIISFGGFSIHAQSINFISKTDINIGLYLFSKLLHGIISLVMGILLFPLFDFSSSSQPVFANYNSGPAFSLYYSALIFFAAIVFIFIIGFFITTTINIGRKRKHYSKVKVLRK